MSNILSEYLSRSLFFSPFFLSVFPSVFNFDLMKQWLIVYWNKKLRNFFINQKKNMFSHTPYNSDLPFILFFSFTSFRPLFTTSFRAPWLFWDEQWKEPKGKGMNLIAPNDQMALWISNINPMLITRVLIPIPFEVQLLPTFELLPPSNFYFLLFFILFNLHKTLFVWMKKKTIILVLCKNLLWIFFSIYCRCFCINTYYFFCFLYTI